MEDAKRRGLEKLKESLILAAKDMDQATAAALRTDTSTDEAWRRALETAMAAAYMRPFTTGAWKLPGKYAPKDRAAKELHRTLETLRNKVYAHLDKASGRSASMKTVKTSRGIATISYGSAWWAFPVQELHAVQALCYDQKERFLTDAAAIHVELEEADGV
jgi:hypothetical protein